MLNLFFCSSIDPSPGFDREPEISKSAEIFGKDCEIQVTLALVSKNNVVHILVRIS
jgi:hypothetical protein